MILKILAIGIIIYLLWAIVHHKKDKSLTLMIFLEYLLTAILVFILIAGVVFKF